MEDNSDLFKIIENYGKCKFESICTEFESIRKKIESDPIISSYSSKVNQILKDNIAIQIFKSSCSIPIKTLASIIKESQETAFKIAVNLITTGQVNAKIDAVNHIVVVVEQNQGNIIVQRAIENSQKAYNKCLYKILDKVCLKRFSLEDINQENLKVHEKEVSLGSLAGLGRRNFGNEMMGEELYGDDHDD